MALAKLNDRKARTIVDPGRYGDGGGLWLQVRDRDRKSWLFRFTLAGRAREMGLGPFPDVGLAEARVEAARCRALLREGRDPLEARRRLIAENVAADARRLSFDEVVAAYLEAHRSSWKNPKHAAQWESTLKTYAAPVIGSTAVADVTTDQVERILRPIWTTKSETASRLRGRIETVLDFAGVRGWRSGDNPARWKGHLSELLPAPSRIRKVKHHAALPWRDVGAFLVDLRGRDGTAARALEFAILTAARTSEVIGATWEEIDLEAKVWTIPAERMKAGRPHRVPLAPRALEILRSLHRESSKPHHIVFPSASAARPLSNMALAKVLQRMERTGITVHGFRSTFRDWCREATNTPREVAEIALAHVNKDKTEAAYARGDAIEKRAALMKAWAEFVAKPLAAGDVVNIGDAREAKAKKSKKTAAGGTG